MFIKCVQKPKQINKNNSGKKCSDVKYVDNEKNYIFVQGDKNYTSTREAFRGRAFGDIALADRIKGFN